MKVEKIEGVGEQKSCRCGVGRVRVAWTGEERGRRDRGEGTKSMRGERGYKREGGVRGRNYNNFVHQEAKEISIKTDYKSMIITPPAVGRSRQTEQRSLQFPKI